MNEEKNVKTTELNEEKLAKIVAGVDKGPTKYCEKCGRTWSISRFEGHPCVKETY